MDVLREIWWDFLCVCECCFLFSLTKFERVLQRWNYCPYNCNLAARREQQRCLSLLSSCFNRQHFDGPQLPGSVTLLSGFVGFQPPLNTGPISRIVVPIRHCTDTTREVARCKKTNNRKKRNLGSIDSWSRQPQNKYRYNSHISILCTRWMDSGVGTSCGLSSGRGTTARLCSHLKPTQLWSKLSSHPCPQCP